MKICILNVFLVWLLSSFISRGAPGTCNIHYSRIDYTYTNISLKGGYEEEVFFNGILKKNKREVMDIPYTELEKIVSIEAGFAIENKWKDIKDFGTRSVIGGSFYSGVKSRTFVYDSQQNDTPISYKYTLKNQELMFLAFLPLNSYECVDTLSYSILIPEDLKLTYKISEDTTSLKSLTITNTKVKNGILWKFVSIVRDKCTLPDSDNPQIVSSKKLPGVRLSIVPAEGYEKEFSYMNDWYRDLIQTKSVLNNESKSIINKWVNVDDKVGIVKALFDSVKGKISYISFENGIGAVQPRDVNEVLNNKQGDCKDMANLLRQSIRLFGIDAWVALSSTIQHRFDLDFPSIASANHAICVVKIDDKLYFLDPTESFCPFGMPSRQIQGCHILIVDSLQGTLVEVPVVSSEKNKVSAIFTLNKSGDNLAGSFIYVLKGLSKLDFETFKGSNSIQYFNS
ncbi:MAG TPA: transglutaminase domain-containing protein [Bacteroidia bacterium]|nr:transglutaminase domain-containing protein [Bacteroidia bacterium]